MNGEIIRRTRSICPVCLERLEAVYVRRGDEIFLEKTCPAHGSFSVAAWRGGPDLLEWCGGWEGESAENPDCPTRCGLCAGHKNRTCCAILDVTTRCDLGCKFCFAASGGGGDMPLEQVYCALDDMYGKGVRFIHLSGGEPTVRDDLESVVSHAARTGFEYIQLNTNGLRLADDGDYAARLRDAGVSSVFLQFDGTDDASCSAIRGRALFELKCRAIDNCDRAELGVVLVPTVIPGINDGALGDIVRFAVGRMPAVKGVHLQPVVYNGRYSSADRPRITLPELLRALEAQTDGLVKAEWFSPSACDSPLCGFHGEFRKSGGALVPLFEKSGCCSSPAGVEGNQNHVKNRWTRVRRADCRPESMDAFLQSLSDRSFCVSAMAFQDAESMDLGRLMRCSVHVYSDGRLIPFCAYHSVHRAVRS